VFLTNSQLQDMTGYRTYTGQAKWLLENGYSFDRRRDGRPNVLLEQVRERQRCGEVRGDSKPGPDFGWLEAGA
jgi:hypothetical protein